VNLGLLALSEGRFMCIRGRWLPAKADSCESRAAGSQQRQIHVNLGQLALSSSSCNGFEATGL